MSKSKKNTIDPQKIIESYGADAVRLFILSDSPPEKDVQWSERGMEAAYKFIQKLWLLHNNILNKKQSESKNDDNENINIFTNTIIKKITKNLENFHYNVIIANLYEIYNHFSGAIKANLDKKNLLSNYIKILKIMNPIIPHFSNECLSQINSQEKITWPKVDDSYLIQNNYKIVIQINGKKRDLINSEKELSESELLGIINKNENVSKFLENKKIKKTIYIKNKLINLII
jgi:leucyl-tRNA synthetase